MSSSLSSTGAGSDGRGAGVSSGVGRAGGGEGGGLVGERDGGEGDGREADVEAGLGVCRVGGEGEFEEAGVREAELGVLGGDGSSTSPPPGVTVVVGVELFCLFTSSCFANSISFSAKGGS